MNSAVLDMAIGMIFIYLLMSLLCSAVQELLSSTFKLRAKNLQQGIDALLNDPNAAFFAHEFHLHPLIDKLAPSGRSPSYIPASHFSAVVMDILDKNCNEDPFKNITAAVAGLPDGQMKQSLRIMAARCKGESDAFVNELEQWFDHSMDRASGWYKRKSQMIMVPIGWDMNKPLCQSVRFLTIVGWLITGCFVSLGAPFWFNTLGKALSLRAAGNKPPRGGA